MATDVFIRKGLTQRQVAKVAARYRHEFEMEYAEFVAIVDVLEFRLPVLYPGFRLVVRPADVLPDEAVTETDNNRILVREDIYNSACEGDAYSRFVLAHELGHFLLHKETKRNLSKTQNEYAENISNLKSNESAESQADIFARHFLIHPSIAFRYRHEVETLSMRTGVPANEAAAAVTISKRAEMLEFRASPLKS